jgi:hypothetical protein
VVAASVVSVLDFFTLGVEVFGLRWRQKVVESLASEYVVGVAVGVVGGDVKIFVAVGKFVLRDRHVGVVVGDLDGYP